MVFALPASRSGYGTTKNVAVIGGNMCRWPFGLCDSRCPGAGFGG